jgi:Raf kinase inhibitor-like YbhB/YbcL family protein
MKLIARALLAIIVLAILFIVVTAVRASHARDADLAFHSSLPKSMTLNSDAFSAGGPMPAVLSCKDAGTSPELSWTRSPDGAKSFVLIVTDWDVPSPLFRLIGYTHWMLFNISTNVSEVKAAVSASDLKQALIEIGKNSSGAEVYAPLCPPMGIHNYVFRIYALDVAQIQPTTRNRQALFDAMKGHVLAYGELVGRFGGPRMGD